MHRVNGNCAPKERLTQTHEAGAEFSNEKGEKTAIGGDGKKSRCEISFRKQGTSYRGNMNVFRVTSDCVRARASTNQQPV